MDVTFGCTYTHRVRFTQGAFEAANLTLASVLSGGGNGPARALAVVDAGVAAAQPRMLDEITAYFAANSGRMIRTGPTLAVPGGEQAKNDQSQCEAVLRAIHDAGLCRRSYVIAVGGGAVLDVVGLAAALAHRGVRLVRVPTTTLSQADSGVAVKNGINAFGKKNYTGAFAVPWAVVQDERALGSLSDRDWRCGFAEAVKVALVKDRVFFDTLERGAAAIARREAGPSIAAVRRSCELHLRHITDGGDPFEQTYARPLDFGHWAAHRLEVMTGFELRHGEAVAIGVAIDARYSVLAGLLTPGGDERIAATLQGLGFDLSHPALGDIKGLMVGLEEFREHLGGRLTIALLGEIGRGVDVHQVDAARMAEAVRWVAGLAGERGGGPVRGRSGS